MFRGRCVLIAQGIDSTGKKHVLGLREGTTENATVAKALLEAEKSFRRIRGYKDIDQLVAKLDVMSPVTTAEKAA